MQRPCALTMKDSRQSTSRQNHHDPHGQEISVTGTTVAQQLMTVCPRTNALEEHQQPRGIAEMPRSRMMLQPQISWSLPLYEEQP